MSPGLSRLLELSARGATGEFIAAGAELELRVCLQAGRVAWANTSHERELFVRLLRETTRLSAELIEEISAQCLRDARPLGETLVMSRLATVAQVRTALRAEIELTLGVLRRSPHLETLFLPRRLSSTYDDALTFDGAIFEPFVPRASAVELQ